MARMQQIIIGVLMVCAACNARAVVPHSYPLFKQTDPRWGGEAMGTTAECDACGCSPATIAEQGCAMSSVSMFLNGRGVVLPQSVRPDPMTLNAWLRATGGYVCAGGDCNNLKLTAPSTLSNSTVEIAFVSEAEKPSSTSKVQWFLENDYGVVLHVRDSSHFVLAVGWEDNTSFLVNDPFFNTTSYAYSGVSDIILYHIQ